MVISMPTQSKESVESLLKEVLEMQKDLVSFLRSKSDNPAATALALHTACAIVLDDHDEGSQVYNTFSEMAARLSTIVDLGHESVLRSLADGSYERVFAISVEIGAADIASDRCPNCEMDEEEIEESKLN